MKTDDLDRLRAAAPRWHAMPALFTEAEREDLLAEVISGSGSSRPRAARRPARIWAYRLAPVAAAGIAAAVAVAVSVQTAAPAGNGHSPAGPGRAGAAQANTVAYVTQHARAALARMHRGSLKVTISDEYGVWHDLEDLSSGANRETFSRASDGAIRADYSSAGHGRAGTFTVVYYPVRAWWTFKGAVPGPAGDFSPRLLRQELSAGALVRAGDGTVRGQRAIHLRSAAKRASTIGGKKYYLGDRFDIWVSAVTFLPIREVSTKAQSHFRVTYDLTWSARPPTRGELTAVPPAGFRHLDGPPKSLLKAGGGQG